MTSRRATAAVTCLAMLVFASVGSAAGDIPSLAALTDTPSAGNSTSRPDPPGFAKSETDNVVRVHSMFFPDLATNKHPLTVGAKFRLFVENSVSGSAFVGSAIGAGVNQATNTPSGYGQGTQGYARRFGSSMATRASTNFFGTFLISSLAQQDPRYFVLQNAPFPQRMNHVISRFIFARNDKGGYGFNWGGMFGPLGAEAVACTYLPVREQTAARTMQRYGTNLATGVGLNVLKEFWSSIFGQFRVK